MPQSSPRLFVDTLSRSFSGRKVVDGISLSVAAGQVTCLLGPSGCGKSTTLRMIAGVEHADEGRIVIDGLEVANGPRHLPPEKRSVGLMFQDFALFPHLTVADNVAFGLTGPKADKARRVWNASICMAMARNIRISFRGANSSGWPWPAPWPRAPR